MKTVLFFLLKQQYIFRRFMFLHMPLCDSFWYMERANNIDATVIILLGVMLMLAHGSMISHQFILPLNLKTGI